MRKTLLLAGVACVLMASNASATWNDYMTGWGDLARNGKVYVGADYAFDALDFKGDLNDAKDNHHSGIFNVGTRIKYIGAEVFGQWSGTRTKHTTDEGKIKTRINAYGLDLFGYQPIGCEDKFDVVATIGAADYYYKASSDNRNDTNNHVGWRAGGGLMYNINEHVSARVLGRYAYIGADDLNHTVEVTGGLRYSF